MRVDFKYESRQASKVVLHTVKKSFSYCSILKFPYCHRKNALTLLRLGAMRLGELTPFMPKALDWFAPT